MNKISVFLLQLLIVMMSLYCSKSGEGRFKGKLFYSSATNHLYELDLSTSREKIIYRENKPTEFITFITRITNHQLILSVDPLRSSPILKLFDLPNNKVRTLREGISPLYMIEHNVVFFYVKEKPHGIKDDMFLYVGNLNRLDSAVLIYHLPKADSTCFSLSNIPVVQISPDKVVFHGMNSSIIEYDYINKKTTEVDLRNLWPLAWRENTGELICCGPRAKDFYLVDWLNKKTRTLDLGEGSMGWKYIKEYDILLFSKERLETGDIYFYDFKNFKIEKLIPNSIVRDNAVFIPEDIIK
jgi:hypothetical protein